MNEQHRAAMVDTSNIGWHLSARHHMYLRRHSMGRPGTCDYDAVPFTRNYCPMNYMRRVNPYYVLLQVSRAPAKVEIDIGSSMKTKYVLFVHATNAKTQWTLFSYSFQYRSQIILCL